MQPGHQAVMHRPKLVSQTDGLKSTLDSQSPFLPPDRQLGSPFFQSHPQQKTDPISPADVYNIGNDLKTLCVMLNP